MGGLVALEPRAAGDVIRSLLALTAQPLGFGLRGVEADPLYVPFVSMPPPDFITYTGGGSAYTRLPDGPDGERWESSAPDTPRLYAFDGSPARVGALVEEERENKLLRNRELNDAAWTLTGGTPIVTPNARLAPNLASQADDIEDNEAGASAYKGQTSMGLNLTPHVMSGFFRWLSGTVGYFRFRTPAANYDFDINGDGDWHRIVSTAQTITISNGAEIRLYPAAQPATNVGKYSFWCGQVEEGAFATTPIPTGASSSVRPADVYKSLLSIPPFNTMASRGRLRVLAIPLVDSSVISADTRRIFSVASGAWHVRYSAGMWRVRGGGDVITSGSKSFSAGDVLVFDWRWDNPDFFCSIWKNGVLDARIDGTGKWADWSGGTAWWLGSFVDSTEQFPCIFQALVIG